MSYGGYQQYGGNPYESAGGAAPTGQPGYSATNPYASEGYGQDVESGGYGGTNPYASSAPQQPSAELASRAGHNTNTSQPLASQGSGAPPSQAYGAPSSQPYGAPASQAYNAPASQGYGASNPQAYNAPASQGYGAPTNTYAAPATIMSNQDFLGRVDGVKSEIRQLTTNIGEIGSIHQRILGSPDNSSSAQLENIVSQTQVLNTRIKDQIKQLEVDSAKDRSNQTKSSQIRTLKSNFKSQLEDFQKEEQTYRQRYKEQIARQYKIVNPEASDVEVREAADADWGNEGVFQTALKSNRSGAATSTLGAVRARHNDIQNIEKTLIELNQLFQDLAEQVILQEAPVQNVEQQTHKVEEDTRQGNVQLDKANASARRARKLKWICFFIVVAIIVIIALALGLYFGLRKN